MNFKKIPKFFRENIAKKTVSLFFAILIWWAVNSRLDAPYEFTDVPVKFLYDETAMVVHMPSEEPTVNLLLKGPQQKLSELKSDDIRVEKTIREAALGVFEMKVPVTRDDVITPPGVRVESLLNTGSVTISVDRIVTLSEIPVSVTMKGALKPGFSVLDQEPFPEKVSIRGPSRLVQQVEKVVTEPVFLDETLDQSFSASVSLKTIPGVSCLYRNPITVDVKVERLSSEKVIDEIPIRVLTSGDAKLALTGKLPNVSVTLYGPKSFLSSMDQRNVKAFVDLTGISSQGNFRSDVQIWLNAGSEVTANYVTPATVEVSLVEAGESVSVDVPESTNESAEN